MNRTFPRSVVLKIEHDSIMPGTSIPTGKNKKVTWEYPRNLAEVYSRVLELKKQPHVVRTTICARDSDGTWVKVRSFTHGDAFSWDFRLPVYASREQRVARTAIIPAEVIREATRSAQS